MERKDPLLHCWWECKLGLLPRIILWRFFKKLKIELPHAPAVPLLHIYLEKSMLRKDTHPPGFTAALLTTAKTRKNLKVHQQRDGRRCGMCMQWGTAQPWEDWNDAVCSNTDGPGENHPLSLSEWRHRRSSIVRHPLYVGSKKKCYKWTYKTEIPVWLSPFMFTWD